MDIHVDILSSLELFRIIWSMENVDTLHYSWNKWLILYIDTWYVSNKTDCRRWRDTKCTSLTDSDWNTSVSLSIALINQMYSEILISITTSISCATFHTYLCISNIHLYRDRIGITINNIYVLSLLNCMFHLS